MPREKMSFFLYGVGKKPEFLSLGTIVLGDYANPSLSLHYSPPPLSDADMARLVAESSLGACRIDAKYSSTYRLGIDVAELFKFDPRWLSSDSKILLAESGLRTEVTNPGDFLKVVLPLNSEARKELKTWVSAMQSDYILSGKWLRTPHIWILTGQYMLDKALSTMVVGNEAGAAAGISSATVAAMSGFPIGGSFDISKNTSLTVEMGFEARHVWAAQWRRLDLKYLKVSADKTPDLPNIINLSKAVCGGELRDSTDFNNAFSVQIAADDNDADPSDEDKHEDSKYIETLKQAIEEVKEYEKS